MISAISDLFVYNFLSDAVKQNDWQPCGWGNNDITMGGAAAAAIFTEGISTDAFLLLLTWGGCTWRGEEVEAVEVEEEGVEVVVEEGQEVGRAQAWGEEEDLSLSSWRWPLPGASGLWRREKPACFLWTLPDWLWHHVTQLKTHTSRFLQSQDTWSHDSTQTLIFKKRCVVVGIFRYFSFSIP